MSEQGRIKIHIGEQQDGQFLRNVTRSCGDQFDMIIDDGSHDQDHQRVSLEYLFPYLASGGFYVIEDLHEAYKFYSPGTISDVLSEMVNKSQESETCREVVGTSSRMSAKPHPDRTVKSVHFYNGICFIKKL